MVGSLGALSRPQTSNHGNGQLGYRLVAEVCGSTGGRGQAEHAHTMVLRGPTGLTQGADGIRYRG